MDPVTITVEELQGDVDTNDVYLTAPVGAIPGGGAPGSTVTGTTVTVLPGLSFLAISENSGDNSYNVQALNTGHPDVDTSSYIVANKDVVPYPDGTELTGYTFQTANGPVLLVQLPEIGGAPTG